MKKTLIHLTMLTLCLYGYTNAMFNPLFIVTREFGKATQNTLNYLVWGQVDPQDQAHAHEVKEKKTQTSSGNAPTLIINHAVTSDGSGCTPDVHQHTASATTSTPVDSKASVNHTSPTNININITNNSSAQPAIPPITPEEIKKAFAYWLEKTTSFLHEYQYWVAGGTAALSYCYIYYKVQEGNSYILDPQRWSSWYAELDNDELRNSDHATLTQELINEIIYRYLELDNPTDMLTPLTKFLKEIQTEREHLQHLLTFSNWLNTLLLDYILPMHEETYNSIAARIERIDFLHKLFCIWSANYKLELSVSTKRNRKLLHDLYEIVHHTTPREYLHMQVKIEQMRPY